MHPCGNIWRSGALLLGPLYSQPLWCLFPFCCHALCPSPFWFSLLISSQGSQPDMVKGDYFTAMLSTTPWHPYYHSESKSPSVILKVLLWLSHSWVTTLLWLHCPIYPVSSSPWIYFRHAHTSRTLVLADFSTYKETPLNIRLAGSLLHLDFLPDVNIYALFPTYSHHLIHLIFFSPL